MSQTETGKAVAADERTEAARSFVHTVKAATRRKHTPEERIRIVLEGFRREVTVSDLCRREGIKPHSYYSWTKEFMEAGKERLTRDTVRDATREEVHQLKRENGELKQLVADLSLEVYRLKKTSIPIVDAQRFCPPKCQGKMSSMQIAMLADHGTSDVARASDMGGLSACMYFLTVSLCMPSSRAIPRMDSPLRFAFCTAFHLAV